MPHTVCITLYPDSWYAVYRVTQVLIASVEGRPVAWRCWPVSNSRAVWGAMAAEACSNKMFQSRALLASRDASAASVTESRSLFLTHAAWQCLSCSAQADQMCSPSIMRAWRADVPRDADPVQPQVWPAKILASDAHMNHAAVAHGCCGLQRTGHWQGRCAVLHACRCPPMGMTSWPGAELI